MSAETAEWLNTQVLVGFTDPQYGRGNAWHYRADLQGEESNHYLNAIPVDDVLRRLYNWEAIEAPVYVGIPNLGGMEYILDPERKAIVRDDTKEVFSVFKSGYQIHSYRQWLIKDVANLLDDDTIAIGTAGLLRGGAKSFVTIELPESVEVSTTGFSVRPHILACTSHDGTLSTTYQLVSTIVVCDNTLAGALGENTPQHKIRHSKHSIGKLQTVRDALTLVHTFTDDLTLELERLAQQSVTDNEFQAIIEHLVPLSQDIDVRPQVKARAENKQELLRHLYKSDPRVAPWSGTALGVLQAWNTYQHHYVGNDKSRVERNMLNGITGKTEGQDRQVLSLIDDLVFA
jgi:phage/plasmid-like protein (TIGR03299 family)